MPFASASFQRASASALVSVFSVLPLYWLWTLIQSSPALWQDSQEMPAIGWLFFLSPAPCNGSSGTNSPTVCAEPPFFPRFHWLPSGAAFRERS